MSYIEKSGLKVDSQLVDFVEKEAIPGTKVTPDQFWSGLARLVKEFAPRNRELLAVRDKLQSQIDDWHRKNGPVAANPDVAQAHRRMQRAYLERASVGDRPQGANETIG